MPRRTPPNKTLVLVLSPAEYRQLELEGRAEERDVIQQARWIVRRHLEATGTEPSGVRDPDSDEVRDRVPVPDAFGATPVSARPDLPMDPDLSIV